MTSLPQGAIPPFSDLREMLRAHIVSRSLACMAAAETRRATALAEGTFAAYQQAIRTAVHGFYGTLPAGIAVPPPAVTPVSTFTSPGFRVENVLFETYPGWQVNATVYVPTECTPPFPVVIVPVGHSGKQYANYQLPCQYFARAGYLAISFDPPGQASEKQPGNDHFVDGVRDYLLGETSSRYFISDAIRCIDYAATRADTDLTHGVAMTGVSGGGTTTTIAALLDDRITVIGPACCVTPLAALDITQGYCGCPETHQFRRYAEGIDEVDLLCAAAPTPCLLMAGETDEVFHIDDTWRLAKVVAGCYAGQGAPERFGFSVDPGGHAYPLTQARAFTRFLHRWLRGEPDRALPELPDDAFALLPDEDLRCYPRTDVNMRTLAVAQAERLAAAWDPSPQAICTAAAAIAGVTSPVSVPNAEIGAPFQVWTHDWNAVMLRPEPDIDLPATWLTARRDTPTPAILHIDDAGRHRLLHRQGLLTAAIRFLDRDRPGAHLLSVDLRGWGDTAPGMHPYEMAGWGSVDRALAYTTAALGDPVMAMRIRDALAALAWVRARPEVDPARIILTASGLGSLVALHVAAIAGAVAGVVAWEGLSSFRSLLAADHYPWPADAFLPNALRHYDLPDLAGALPCPVRLFGLRDGQGQPADERERAQYQASPSVVVSPGSEPARVVEAITVLLAEGAPV
jgi:dienelactone hydrolase